MSEGRRGLSLAARIFLGTALILVVALGAAVIAVSTLGERIATRSARDRISASSSVQNAAQQQRFQQLGLLAEVMAGNPDFKAYVLDAMGLRDRASILDQLEERRADLGYDLAIVTDPKGIVVARTDQPEVSGADLSVAPAGAQGEERVRGVRDLAGRRRGSTRRWRRRWRSRGSSATWSSAIQVTDVRALEVKRGTGSEVVFLAGSTAAPVASSLTPQETERVLGRGAPAGKPAVARHRARRERGAGRGGARLRALARAALAAARRRGEAGRRGRLARLARPRARRLPRDPRTCWWSSAWRRSSPPSRLAWSLSRRVSGRSGSWCGRRTRRARATTT